EVAGDPCLNRFAREAWFRIETKTTIELPAKTRKNTETGLRKFPNIWQGNDRLVQIIPPRKISADSVLAVLEASAQLQVWEFTPTLDTQAKQIVLMLLEDASADNELAKKLRDEPELAHAIAGIQARTLTIIARSESGLADAIRQLASASNRALCPKQGACLLTELVGERENEVDDAAESETDPENQAIVLSLKTIGYRHGFVGQGSGTHILRFVWQRPPTWSLTQTPELYLDIRLPQSPLVDQDNTSLSVRVNGQPIATWHVYDDSKKQMEQIALNAKVPMDFASDNALSFEITIRIGLKEDVACEAINDEAVWLVLEGSSHLLVERDETHYQGIAAFYRSTESQRPVLSTKEPITSWIDVLWLGTILHPFVDQTRSQRWRWTVEGDLHARIEIHSRAESVEDVTEIWWLASATTEGLPLITLANTTRLSASELDLLKIKLGRLTKTPPESPPYPALVNAEAFWANPNWVGLEGNTKEKDVRKVRAVESGVRESRALVKSQEERKLQTINLIWAGLAGFMLLATAFYWRKRPTLVANKNIEEMNEKDNA
ncbi:MAG: cellulose biosynthesis cyclic di-GMP-binding regulatory protein BcsB, partial [Kofleriaceae bacterium]|nr:cellulose biosynthesis cyclic di-GMP-binding regulatory protein BcsB [Kofleriaceae bacterium]